MTDRFGALRLPAAAPVARADLPAPLTAEQASLTDPCLDTILSFCSKVLQAQLDTAWKSRAKGTHIDEVAKHLATHDPREVVFNTNRLPGLFLYRVQVVDTGVMAADHPTTTEILRLEWVFPPDTQEKDRLRANIVNGLLKSLVQACQQGRHPAWVVAGDLADTDAIRVASPTSTTEKVYFGADLNGIVGGGDVYAARPVTVTRSGDPNAFNTVDPIVITGTLFTGESGFSETLVLDDAPGMERVQTAWNFSRVESIAVPAQTLTTGALAFGFADSPEVVYGSPVRRHAGLRELRCVGARRDALIVRMARLNDKDRQRADDREYDSFQLDLRIVEAFNVDVDALPPLGDGTDGVGITTDFLLHDGSTFASADYT